MAGASASLPARGRGANLRVPVGRWSDVAYSTALTAKEALSGRLIVGPTSRQAMPGRTRRAGGTGRFGRVGRIVEDVAFDAAAVPDPLSDDNIIGVGVGKKVRAGEIVGGLCV